LPGPARPGRLASVINGDGDAWRQSGYDVRFDCGAPGAARQSRDGGMVVLVDVLSFTTAVSVAVQRGTSAVYPIAAGGARAARLAGRVNAALAVARSEVTAQRPWSLSPAALRIAPPAPRLVLPSANGSAIAAAVGTSAVAACLRNAASVGGWLARRAIDAGSPVTVIAAGERGPNGILRPALEDLLGAGAVIAALVARRSGLRLSPEAAAALALHRATPSVPDAVRTCASGVELADRGYYEDVEVAIEADADHAVPVLVDGAFRPASSAVAGVPTTRAEPDVTPGPVREAPALDHPVRARSADAHPRGRVGGQPTRREGEAREQEASVR